MRLIDADKLMLELKNNTSNVIKNESLTALEDIVKRQPTIGEINKEKEEADNQVKLNFAITDEFGQKTEFKQSVNLDTIEAEYDCPNIYFMVGEFKKFLLASGYSYDVISKLKIED